jgi:hypothetical protein
MHPVLKRSFIFIALILLGLALYVMMFSMNARRYDDTAVPYLNKTLPVIARWNFSELAPMLSPQARAEFETDKGKDVYRLFTQLGELESIGKPQYIADQSEFSDGLGEVDIVSYTIPVVFESGPAVIKMLLAGNGESYYIHHLGISSEIFSRQLE